MYFLILMFTLALLTLSKMELHFLSILLSIEFLMLTTYMSIVFFFFMPLSDSFSVFYFLATAVCEGALGLSILVTMVRSKGKDLLLLK